MVVNILCTIQNAGNAIMQHGYLRNGGLVMLLHLLLSALLQSFWARTHQRNMKARILSFFVNFLCESSTAPVEPAQPRCIQRGSTTMKINYYK